MGSALTAGIKFVLKDLYVVPASLPFSSSSYYDNSMAGVECNDDVCLQYVVSVCLLGGSTIAILSNSNLKSYQSPHKPVKD